MKQNQLKELMDKNEKSNIGVEINVGMTVKDIFGNLGIVVDIKEGENIEEHGIITVWQKDKTNYGSDNCEHYVHFGWGKMLEIVNNPYVNKEIRKKLSP